MGVKALAALLLSLALLQQAACQAQGIIRVSGGRFVDDTCNEYLFSGWNGWRILDYAVSDPGFLTSKFQQAQANNLNMLRFFLVGGGDEGGAAQLLTAPGQLDERVARGLDFVIAEAAKYDIKLSIAFMNLWKNGGVPQLEKWCGTSGISVRPRPDIDLRPPGALNATDRLTTPYAWLTSPKCRDQVKDFYSAVVNRKNSLTGVLYKDDPAIFSWNLINEPRCKYCGPEAVDSWIGDMSAHLKIVDPNHLVTTGQEGFFDEADPLSWANPGDGNLWASRSGQDFRANHAQPGVDYAVIHLWPDNWGNPGQYDVQWGAQWIDAHAQAAAAIGKPLVLEEFGKNSPVQNISTVRDPWFLMVSSEVDRSLQGSGALRGALFWQWDGETGPRGDGSNIRETDSTFEHITSFAHRLAAQSGSMVPGCTPRAGSAPSPTLGPAPSPATGPSPSPATASAPGPTPGGVQLFQQRAGAGGRKLLR